MKSIPIRQFQRNFYKELKGVPFIVTRQDPHTREDNPEYIVTAYDERTANQTPEQQHPLVEVKETEPSQGSVAQVADGNRQRSMIDKIFGK